MVSQTIDYIEEHLDCRLNLETVASALHYSKYHLHRIFTKTVGLTLHDYVQRRQLTEAAKLLVFSKRPVVEIALVSGYESQQAFTGVFKEMYKTTPVEYRAAEEFYPLQLPICLCEEPIKMDFTKDDIRFATLSDAKDWMELMRLAIDGYPCLKEEEYLENLSRYIEKKQALILRDEGMAIGILAFSKETGNIDFWAVHPQYRGLGMEEMFLNKLAEELLRGKEISLTTYREGDKADTGHRKTYLSLGFAERELLTEYGYPTQRFVLPTRERENASCKREGENISCGKRK